MNLHNDIAVYVHYIQLVQNTELKQHRFSIKFV